MRRQQRILKIVLVCCFCLLFNLDFSSVFVFVNDNGGRLFQMAAYLSRVCQAVW
ncbi:hypothetical protein HMPREF9120_00496 [Neisseria sp. oral taxon 020 str. F0370]|nr:hypothetical protein HMPREF9120_00496 [Neisseria sp. oral taxon 020 str. F0370]